MLAINAQQNVQPNFPMASLHEKLQSVIYFISQETQASPDLIASSVLGAMALACQDLFDISPKQSLKFPVSLYQVTLAESGERKTTVDKMLMAPIRDLERKLESIYLEQKNEYKRAMNIWSIEHRALEKSLARSVCNGGDKKSCEEKLQACWDRRPTAPVRKRLLINDATRAAVKQALGIGWPSIGLFSDEAGSILTGELLRDTPFLNSLWSGQTIEVDRAKGDSFRIADARLSCMLMVQPKLFDDFLDRQGNHARGSGFFARTLICQPRSTIGMRFNMDKLASDIPSIGSLFNPMSLDWFHERLTELIEQSFSRRDSDINRICLTLSPEASVRWNDEYNRIEGMITPFGALNNFKDYASKQLEHVSRIAGVIEGFMTGGTVVSDMTMCAAISIADWYLCSFVHLMSKNTLPEEIMDANTLYSWLGINYLQWTNGCIPKGHILKFGPNSLRSRERLNRALDILYAQGKVNYYKFKKSLFIQYVFSTI